MIIHYVDEAIVQDGAAHENVKKCFGDLEFKLSTTAASITGKTRFNGKPPQSLITALNAEKQNRKELITPIAQLESNPTLSSLCLQLSISGSTQPSAQDVTEYRLPSLNNGLYKHTILDQTTPKSYDLPMGMILPLDKEMPCIDTNKEIKDPTVHDRPVIRKEARRIQKLRRWRMNRHQLKKLRKRMKYEYRKQRIYKAKKKEAAIQAELDAIMLAAKEWDPLKDVVKQNLDFARRGGYSVNVWETRNKKQS
ncbi:unnamed protein product [Owenia fusiformis]|uniref:Mitochondrial mRNA-processing protein COX24 C-terminal domain-containing protein n=1 Tax=Owenia fusiformis TaxID=6347 RepID=A0A8S4N0E1_OWEFU|nr:unnamed protein product [Owenia fusiformis]